MLADLKSGESSNVHCSGSGNCYGGSQKKFHGKSSCKPVTEGVKELCQKIRGTIMLVS